MVFSRKFAYLRSISSTFYAHIFLYKSALRSFSLVMFWLCNFLAKRYLQKKACLNCWWNWHLEPIITIEFSLKSLELIKSERLGLHKVKAKYNKLQLDYNYDWRGEWSKYKITHFKSNRNHTEALQFKNTLYSVK